MITLTRNFYFRIKLPKKPTVHFGEEVIVESISRSRLERRWDNLGAIKRL